MLQLIDVSKTFNPGTVNEKKALSHLNLELQDGDFRNYYRKQWCRKINDVQCNLRNIFCGRRSSDPGWNGHYL